MRTDYMKTAIDSILHQTYDNLELIIVVEASNNQNRIKDEMIEFNKTSAKKYELELSIGYAVYDCRECLSLDEFQKKIDRLMYMDKEELKRA